MPGDWQAEKTCFEQKESNLIESYTRVPTQVLSNVIRLPTSRSYAHVPNLKGSVAISAQVLSFVIRSPMLSGFLGFLVYGLGPALIAAMDRQSASPFFAPVVGPPKGHNYEPYERRPADPMQGIVRWLEESGTLWPYWLNEEDFQVATATQMQRNCPKGEARSAFNRECPLTPVMSFFVTKRCNTASSQNSDPTASGQTSVTTTIFPVLYIGSRKAVHQGALQANGINLTKSCLPADEDGKREKARRERQGQEGKGQGQEGKRRNGL